MIEDQIKQAEENIIKNEILPRIENDIAPLLKDVQRELVLVVDYKPGEDIRLHMSRRRNFGEILKKQGAKEIIPDSQAEHDERPAKQSKKSPSITTDLEVIFPDGTIIAERHAADTFEQAIRKIGVERVRDVAVRLGRRMVICKVPLISNTRDSKYGSSQRDMGNGWYLMTNCCNQRKAELIKDISDELGLGLKANYTESPKRL